MNPMEYVIPPVMDVELGSGAIDSTEFVEKQNSAIVRQTRMAKGDFYISR
jgi:hypothetical protein